MRIEARRYVFSIMVVLLVGVAYAQTAKVETENVKAVDSQKSIQPSNTNFDNAEAVVGESKVEKEAKETLEENNSEAEAEAAAAEKAKAAESKVRTFRATAYCLKGRTALGHRVRRGLIAADPRVLPLGSTVEIVSGRYAGTYLVSDTGGKVRGNKIDIWVPSCREARRWGHRPIKLRVLKKKIRKKKARR